MNYKIREINTSKKWHTGKIITLKSGRNITIQGQDDRYLVKKEFSKWGGDTYKSYDYFIISFDDGYTRSVCSAVLRDQSFHHPEDRVVCDIGYLGFGEYTPTKDGSHTKEYVLWSNMLHRVYGKTVYHTYKDCEVAERWYNFQWFCEDILLLKGYVKWKEVYIGYELDKDMKVEGNKIYSKDTCMFVTHEENTKHATITGIKYRATRLSDGYTEEFTNQSAFARKWGLDSTGVCKCVAGKIKTHRGWKITPIK